MNEIDSILDAWRSGRAANGILATVVRVQGFAYRRPGARMLILPDGSRVGSISGGGLEGDVSRKAWWLTEDGCPVVRVYDTTSDDDVAWEFGLGCNGIIHVLLERIDTSAGAESMRFLESCRSTRCKAVIATVIAAGPSSPSKIGERFVFTPTHPAKVSAANAALLAAIRPHVDTAFKTHKSCLVHAAGCDVFVEFIGPPVPLVIFGAGHDAIPVTASAKQLGWHVTIADSHPAYARKARFPEADRVVALQNHDLLAGLDIGPETVVVIMTHNYPLDARLLRRILPLRPRYLGLLGPRNRMERLMTELRLDAQLADVHSPVGLDIGGDAPEAIALSIVAEIQACLSNRMGGMLKYRRAPIHEPVVEIGGVSTEVIMAPEHPSCDLTHA